MQTFRSVGGGGAGSRPQLSSGSSSSYAVLAESSREAPILSPSGRPGCWPGLRTPNQLRATRAVPVPDSEVVPDSAGSGDSDGHRQSVWVPDRISAGGHCPAAHQRAAGRRAGDSDLKVHK